MLHCFDKAEVPPGVHSLGKAKEFTPDQGVYKLDDADLKNWVSFKGECAAALDAAIAIAAAAEPGIRGILKFLVDREGALLDTQKACESRPTLEQLLWMYHKKKGARGITWDLKSVVTQDLFGVLNFRVV